MFASLHGAGNLTALAFEFSPMVEQTAPDTVAFDAAGLNRLFGLPQEVAAAIARRAAESGIQASLALAANPDAAICAARGFRGTHIIPQGDEAKYLGPLPLELLAPAPALQETLERWGIRRFRDLAALPPLGIAERLGTEGLELRELARGEVQRKLRPLTEPESFAESMELDYPLELLEPLAFLLARLLHGLATRLATRGLATDELRLRLKLEDRTTFERTLRLPVPSLDSRAFLKLIQLDLTAHPPPAAIVHVWLEVNPVKPQAAQGGLYAPAAPEPVKLELTLARLKAMAGAERVGSPELIDTHHPDAFRLTDYRPRPDPNSVTDRGVHAAQKPRLGTPWSVTELGLALRIFRPPLPARVTLAAGQPSLVEAHGIRGRVVDIAGPWRTSGDWWTSDPWSRDEWDIALSDGVLYRLYSSPGGWFLEGSYD